jgi:hypothetical protein
MCTTVILLYSWWWLGLGGVSFFWKSASKNILLKLFQPFIMLIWCCLIFESLVKTKLEVCRLEVLKLFFTPLFSYILTYSLLRAAVPVDTFNQMPLTLPYRKPSLILLLTLCSVMHHVLWLFRDLCWSTCCQRFRIPETNPIRVKFSSCIIPTLPSELLLYPEILNSFNMHLEDLTVVINFDRVLIEFSGSIKF